MFMPVWFTIILCKQSCGRGLFPKNLPRVNYTQTCHPISTLQRQYATGQCVLLKDRTSHSQYNTKHWEEYSTFLHPIFADLFHFLHFNHSHLPPHTLPKSLLHSTRLFLLPELRWMSLIWNSASLSFGMSFQVARNTWRSEKQRDKRIRKMTFCFGHSYCAFVWYPAETELHLRDSLGKPFMHKQSLSHSHVST